MSAEHIADAIAKAMQGQCRDLPQATALGDCDNVTSAVQHADNNQFIRSRLVIDGVGAVESDAQVRCELIPRGAGKREMLQWLERRFDLADEARRDLLGCTESDPRPEFGEIGFRRVGYAECERAASNFRPRSMMLLASKSLTRPSARSAKPLSISA